MEKVSFYCTFVSREPRKVQKVKKVRSVFLGESVKPGQGRGHGTGTLRVKPGRGHGTGTLRVKPGRGQTGTGRKNTAWNAWHHVVNM